MLQAIGLEGTLKSAVEAKLADKLAPVAPVVTTVVTSPPPAPVTTVSGAPTTVSGAPVETVPTASPVVTIPVLESPVCSAAAFYLALLIIHAALGLHWTSVGNMDRPSFLP